MHKVFYLKSSYKYEHYLAICRNVQRSFEEDSKIKRNILTHNESVPLKMFASNEAELTLSRY